MCNNCKDIRNEFTKCNCTCPKEFLNETLENMLILGASPSKLTQTICLKCKHKIDEKGVRK
jgi:hypothetical protein